ncbi:MAG: 1-deoxy-D-xylulose-5-phosphate synthase, partial [Calditrichia bacterium]|nr:1-deoxy-D-xylulose-5-phosphate synthase [Calditrichia bacterium]
MSNETKILEKVDYPSDIRSLNIEELKTLALEIREFLIDRIPKIGGHLASSLGVVELTIAIHYVYNTPEDKTVWDVGHQGYVHKMLTGRKDRMDTIRRLGGISGFLKRSESEYDNFGAGHATTSLSAALGIAVARDRLGEKNKVVAIIGDGALTGGIAYEAMNNLGNSNSDMTIILNDNNMSISPNVGAMSHYLDEIITNPVYRRIKNDIWNITEKLPGKQTIRKIIRETQHSIKRAVTPGLLFEALGIQYFGPVDGHNLDELIRILKRIEKIEGPKLLHVLTKKGKGMQEAEADPISFHGVSPSSGSTGLKNPDFLDVVGKTLSQLADMDGKVTAITAAMIEGTGLKHFMEKHAEKLYDVGIAEEHAVLFAAGLATQGIRPFVTIYSTFLQRA